MTEDPNLYTSVESRLNGIVHLIATHGQKALDHPINRNMIRKDATDIIADVRYSGVWGEVARERDRQDARWGEQNHDDYRWLAILTEEMGELAQAILHDEYGGKHAGTMREELVQVAAVAIQWLQCLDRAAQPIAPRRRQ